MKQNKPTQEYGKPYTPKDFRQVGVGMFIAGVIAIVFGTAAYQNGMENQMILTKGGNEIHGSDPSNPLFYIIGIFGLVLSAAGVFFWLHGKRKES